MSLLRAVSVTRRFGGLTAISKVDLIVEPGQISLIIGPNGAGKTTLFNCLSGVDRPDEGSVFIDGDDMTGMSAAEFAGHGLMRTFQHARPFGGLTVAENIMVGAHVRSSAGLLRGTLRTPGARAEERRLRESAMQLLENVGLSDRASQPAGELSLADERRLEVARCLAGEPRIMLLDEPVAGLGHEEADELAALFRRLRDERGIAVLLIEHHLDLALALADDVTVLNFGEVIARGSPAAVRDDPSVIEAYVGGAA